MPAGQDAPASEPDRSAPAPARPRLVGLDVARCLALLGMMATHLLAPTGPDGTASTSHLLAAGRSSALFAVLAGVTLGLLSGGRRPAHGAERLARSGGIVVRAVLIGLLGLMLGEIDSGLAIILCYYALLFCLALPFLGWGPRPLLALAAAWVVAAPVLSHLVRPGLPARGYDSPAFDQLAEPGRLLAELTLTGYYPALPWLAYALVGLAVARLDLRDVRVQGALAAAGVALTSVALGVSAALTARDDVAEALLGSSGVSREALPALLAQGQYGTTPAGGPWQWLLVASPHTATPFDLAATIGSSLAVIGVCLLVVGVLPAMARRAVAVLFGAGTMTLTLYSLHAVLRTDDLWPETVPDAYLRHVLLVLGLGIGVVGLGRRGPLEAGVHLASSGVTSGLRAALRPRVGSREHRTRD